jgi:hypothetical protein
VIVVVENKNTGWGRVPVPASSSESVKKRAAACASPSNFYLLRADMLCLRGIGLSFFFEGGLPILFACSFSFSSFFFLLFLFFLPFPFEERKMIKK